MATAAPTLLDASALLAVILEEDGSEEVADAIERGTRMTATNMAEVIVKLLREKFTREEIERLLLSMPIQVIDVSAELAYMAAYMEPATRSLGLSLADRICLAAAARYGYVAVTADRAWGKAKIARVSVRVIR